MLYGNDRVLCQEEMLLFNKTAVVDKKGTDDG